MDDRMEGRISKRLYRSRNSSMIAGVCGGIGEYLDVDPTIIRLILALATFFTAVFPGIIVYLIMWIVVPLEKIRL